jgi:hypothetical protein
MLRDLPIVFLLRKTDRSCRGRRSPSVGPVVVSMRTSQIDQTVSSLTHRKCLKSPPSPSPVLVSDVSQGLIARRQSRPQACPEIAFIAASERQSDAPIDGSPPSRAMLCSPRLTGFQRVKLSVTMARLSSNRTIPFGTNRRRLFLRTGDKHGVRIKDRA